MKTKDFLFIICFLFLFSCKKDNPPSPNQPNVVTPTTSNCENKDTLCLFTNKPWVLQSIKTCWPGYTCWIEKYGYTTIKRYFLKDSSSFNRGVNGKGDSVTSIHDFYKKWKFEKNILYLETEAYINSKAYDTIIKAQINKITKDSLLYSFVDTSFKNTEITKYIFLH